MQRQLIMKLNNKFPEKLTLKGKGYLINQMLLIPLYKKQKERSILDLIII